RGDALARSRRDAGHQDLAARGSRRVADLLPHALACAARRHREHVGGGFHWAPDFDAAFLSNGHAEHVPFNGDRYIGDELRTLIELHGVRSAIETGTWSAHTTRELRTMVSGRVTTIDTTDEHLVAEFGPDAVGDLAQQDIAMVLGDSREKLAEVLAAH